MSGEFENFLVCNYGESRDKQEMSKACFSEVDDSTIVPQVSDSKFSIEMREGPPAVSSMSMDPVSKDHEHSRIFEKILAFFCISLRVLSYK